jgi:sugar lactone lactonase YvrE
MTRPTQFLAGLTYAGVLLLASAPYSFADNSRPIGDSRFIAAVPFPGYPEGIVVKDGRIYVSGPAAFGFSDPSTIHVYSQATGAFIKDIAIQGQPAYLRALSCLAADDEDNLYVVDEALGIVKINLDSGQQSIYAAGFHPVFQSAFNPPAPVLLNDLAFDKKGNLYITDTFQATIWRVPPGGGAPQVWYSSSAIDGIFGPNGIRMDAASQKMYFTVTFDGTGKGYVYTLPLVDHPTDADLTLFHAYTTPFEGPDGVAFGKSGKLYVALAGYSQISVLRPDGSEETRFSGPAQRPGDPGNPLVWQNPANIAFDNGSRTLLVTNHASLVPNPEFAVFDVYVNDQAGKLFGPGGENQQ